MNDLIQINQTSINGSEINSVEAREIHDYLEVKTPFSMWFSRSVEKYDFINGLDFIPKVEKSNGGRPKENYIVSLDMAKELSMLENNPKGKETRKYFINFEKKAVKVIRNHSQELEMIEKMVGVVKAINAEVNEIDERVKKIEQTKRLESYQEKALQDAKNRKVYSLATIHGFENDNAMIRKMHSRVWKTLKNKFNIPRYNELLSMHYESGLNHINNLVLGDLAWES